MSEALSYLVKARPEAMGHYLAFMKDAGSRLDPKTRDLISVITKVHAQTERGLRQYLKRALADGCTPAEILDALLMAFPALGLSKIVWAVDIILAMKLPGFEPDALARVPAWHELPEAAQMPAPSVRRLEADGRAVFVSRSSEGFRVFDTLCPHQGTNIPELALAGTRLVCPKHRWTFDATSGACVENGERPLREFESRWQDGRLQALW